MSKYKNKYLPKTINWFRLPDYLKRLFEAEPDNSAEKLLAFDSEGNPVTVDKSTIGGGGGSTVTSTSELINDGADSTSTFVEADELGTAAVADSTDFATAAQGITADSAIQPGDLGTVATSNDYNDLDNIPPTTIPGIDSVLAEGQSITSQRDITITGAAGSILVTSDDGVGNNAFSEEGSGGHYFESNSANGSRTEANFKEGQVRILSIDPDGNEASLEAIDGGTFLDSYTQAYYIGSKSALPMNRTNETGKMMFLGDSGQLLLDDVPTGGGVTPSFNDTLLVDPVTDQNVTQQSANEQSWTMQRLGTIGITENPRFHFGRIVNGGINEPKLRIGFQDDLEYTSEVFPWEVEPSGTMASIRQVVGSHIEAFIAGQVEPMFRLASTDIGGGNVSTRIELGSGDGNATDVFIERQGDNQLGIVLSGGTKQIFYPDAVVKPSGIVDVFVDTPITPSNAGAGSLKVYNKGGVMYQLDENGVETALNQSGGASSKYNQTFLSTDFVSSVLTITAATHGVGTKPIIQVFDLSGDEVIVDKNRNAAGDITITVASGFEFDGEITIL